MEKPLGVVLTGGMCRISVRMEEIFNPGTAPPVREK